MNASAGGYQRYSSTGRAIDNGITGSDNNLIALNNSSGNIP
jgi:hypothetical protein